VEEVAGGGSAGGGSRLGAKKECLWIWQLKIPSEAHPRGFRTFGCGRRYPAGVGSCFTSVIEVVNARPETDPFRRVVPSGHCNKTRAPDRLALE